MRAFTTKQIRRFARLVQTAAATVSGLIVDDLADLLIVGCAFH